MARRVQWNIKPQPGTPLLRHPLSPSVLAYTFAEGAGGFTRNYAKYQQSATISPAAGTLNPVSGTNATWGVGKRGRLLSVANGAPGAAVLLGTFGQMNISDSCTIILGQRKRSPSTFLSAGCFGPSSNTSRLGTLLPFSDGIAYFDYQSNGSGRIQASGLTFGDDIWAFTAGPRGQEMWQNGQIVASQGTSLTFTGSDSEFYLGGWPQFGLGGDDVDFDFFYLWNSQIPQQAILELTARPYACFDVYRPKWFGIPPAGASIVATSIDSSEAWGTLKLSLTIFPSSIPSSEAWGTLKLSLALLLTSIPSSEAWGTPSVTVGPVDVAVTSIPSSEAWGTPTVAGPIRATSIPSSEAWGTLHLVEQNQVLFPASIPSSEAWGTPVLAGPVSLLGIPSQAAFGFPGAAGPVAVTSIPTSEAWGTPTLNVIQAVAVTAIPSSEAWGTPHLAHVISVFPSSIPSSEAWGTPTIAGGHQRVQMTGIRSSEAWGIPTLTGPPPIPIQMLIAGLDQTARLRQGIANYQATTLGRATLTFDLFDEVGDFTPELAQTVVLYDMGRRLFGGCLNDIVVDRVLSRDAIFYHCTAIDKGAIADHRVVFKTYVAGTNWAAVVLDIVANFMNGEGVTTNHVAVDTDGTLSTDMIFYGCTVRQAFDQVATDVGTVWWFDEWSDLNFPEQLVLEPCPFSFTETSKNWRKLTVETTLVDYRNKQWAISDRNTVPNPNDAGGLENITITETKVLPDPASDAAGYVLGTLTLELPWQSVVSLKVNGVLQPFITGPETYLNNIRHSWWGFGGSPYIYPPYVGNDIPALPTPPEGTSPDPVIGDVVEVKYIAQVRAAQVAQQAALAPLDPGLGGGTGTCGSGVYEAVEMVQNITSIEDLNAIAVAVLERSGGIPTILIGETDDPGGKIGQVFTVDLPKNKLVANDLIVTGINATSMSVDLGKGSTFRTTLTATRPTDIGGGIKWFERLVGRTANAVPLDRFEEGQFILAPGTSLSAGVVPSNPVIVSNTGLLFEVLIAADAPPVGQDLVVDVLARSPGQDPSQAVSIFLPGKQPALPAGELDVQITGAAAFGNSYLFRNQILKPVVLYRVRSSGTVTAASGVTMKVRWSY